MKILATILAIVALGLTIIPSILVFTGRWAWICTNSL